MTNVWYVGTSIERIISSADWLTIEVTGPTVDFSYQNGWAIDESTLVEGQLDYFTNNPDYLTGQSGPRTFPTPPIVPGEDISIRAGAVYLKAMQDLIANFDGEGGGGGGGITEIVQDDSPQLGADLDLNSHKVGAATAADLSKLHSAGTLTGNNTGDQDLSSLEHLSNKGAVNGYAPLDASALVPAVNLPSYVDDVLEFTNLAGFPGTGVTGKIYVALDTNKTYRWSGSAYIEISPSPGSTDSVTEGSSNLYYTAAHQAAATHALSSKTTPVDADEFAGVDSAASNGPKKFSWVNIKATLKTYFDTLYVALGGALGTPTSGDLTNCTFPSALAARDTNGNLSADAFIPGSTSTVTSATPVILTVDSTGVQIFTGNTAQTVQLPTTGIVAGQRFEIVYPGLNVLTVQSSGANTIAQLSGLVNATFVALVNTPTTAAHWAYMVAPSMGVGASVSNSTIVQRTGQGNVQANNFLPNITSTTTSGGTSGMTNASAHIQLFIGTTTHTLTLPTTSVAAGWAYKIINTSTGAITINASGGALVKTLAAGAQTEITALAATPTLAAHWFAT